MNDFIPQDPDSFETFDALLAEYNTVHGCELKFFFDEHPDDIDFIINNECTADGYDVWVMRSHNESICLCDNVYYYQPDADDVLRELKYMDECNVYCEIEQYEIEEALRDRLYTNYDNYKTNLEDEKDR
jgi:hypothetical protein